jgi:hypothetical protein
MEDTHEETPQTIQQEHRIFFSSKQHHYHAELSANTSIRLANA